MMLDLVVHPYKGLLKYVLIGVLMLGMWVTGCRADDASCASNDACAEDEVCGSTGVCEPRVVRQRARRELFYRVSADMKAYGLWLQYGTAGRAAYSSPIDTEHTPPIGTEHPAPSPTNGRVSSHQHSRSQQERANHETPQENAQPTPQNEENPSPQLDTDPLCAIEDVRTDDLTFHTTRAYPGGYWGEVPIADPHAGRCGDDLETLAWRLLNCERLSRELPPLECDMRLVWISRQHADDMASREFFGHINPDGHDSFHRLSGRGIQYGLAGENLARQTSVYNAHAAWMRSPLHRRNILTEQYQYAGIGIVAAKKQLLLTETFIGGVDASSPEPPPDEARLHDVPSSEAP